MDLKDVLVLLDASPASEGCLRLATCIARDHEASLSAVFVHADQADGVRPSPGVKRCGLVDQLLPNMTEIAHSVRLADNAEQQLRECHRAFGGEGEWHQLDRADRRS